MANPPRLEAIEGQVADARYHIDRTSFRVPPIEHGWIRLGANPVNVDASFLYFEKADEATEVHRNLSRLKGESFLRSHFVIESQMNVEDNTNVFARTLVYKPKTCFWVAVEKIDNTLDKYKGSNQPFFRTRTRTRLRSQYQNIIRDIIRGMCQIHQEGLTHGVLQSKHVVIIKERAKFAYITNGNADSPATDFTSLKNLFNTVLGQVGDIPNGWQHFPDIENVKEELKHFHLSANVNDGRITLRKLYFHPLLMSCGERLLLVVTANTRSRYRTRTIGQQIFDYGQRFGRTLAWKSVVTEAAYKTVLNEKQEGREYRNESWDQFLFGRNTIVHINENIRKANDDRRNPRLQEKSEAAVERDLSSMFPEYFTRVYDFFKLHEITPSLRLYMGEPESEFERSERIP